MAQLCGLLLHYIVLTEREHLYDRTIQFGLLLLVILGVWVAHIEDAR